MSARCAEECKVSALFKLDERACDDGYCEFEAEFNLLHSGGVSEYSRGPSPLPTSTPPDHVTLGGKHYPRWAAMREASMRRTIELLEEIFPDGSWAGAGAETP